MVGDDDNLEDIRKLYPYLTDDKLWVARVSFRRYVAALLRIYDRLQAEGRIGRIPTAAYKRDR
jgi:hypothetical protein